MERLAGKVVLLWGWRRYLVAFLAGAVAVLGQAPFDFPVACFVAFPVLVWLLDGAAGDAVSGIGRRLRPAFATGWWFGFGYFVVGLWWIGNALLVEADAFAWALPLAVIALPALLAVFTGLGTAAARLLWSDNASRLFALAAALAASEWLRGILFTGFPWNSFGLAAMPVPLMMQSVSIAGVYGITALAVYVFSVPALLATRGPVTPYALAALIVVAHLGFGVWRLNLPVPDDAQTLTLRIVQPSIPQTDKWDAAIRDENFNAHLALTREAPQGGALPTVVIWPETSVPYLLTDRPQALAAMGESLQDGQVLLAGVVRAEPDPRSAMGQRFYNSITAIDADGQIIDAADKVHLVPFGEYVPFENWLERAGITKIVQTPISFTAGSSRRLLDLPGGLKALPLVCYEVIFPGLSAPYAAASDLIVNVTNDAWFGDTPGPYQHFRQAQIRAAEMGRPLVRAANNGISGVIDSRGRVVDAFDLNVKGALDAAVSIDKLQPLLPWSNQIHQLVIIFAFAGAGLLRRTHG